jgi:hypothetical protein
MGEIQFEVTITHDYYSADEVREQLLNGDMYMCYGDAVLYDGDGAEVGTVEWAGDGGGFVVHEASVPRITADADGRKE